MSCSLSVCLSSLCSGVERADYFHAVGGVPENLLRQVAGEVILAESQPYVVPLKAYPIEAVNAASKQLCQVCLATLDHSAPIATVPTTKVYRHDEDPPTAAHARGDTSRRD